jgi:hypothetical protein
MEAYHNLAKRFKRFGERECLPASPLYARLAVAIAGDPEMLAIAAAARAAPVPNLLFAGVQYLLLRGADHPLVGFYPACGGDPGRTDIDPVPLFRDFCLAHADAIRRLLETRRVQTNEVRRCALLLPAFAVVAGEAAGRPLAIVEIGASAGLNLLWDRYGYDYGGARCGDPEAPVQLRCALRGAQAPPIPATMPSVAWRVGLDLKPIDVHDDDAVLWLRALTWPEQVERAALLEHALDLARREPPLLLAGDALELLPGVLQRVPGDAALCLVHTFTLNQFTPEMRDQFWALAAGESLRRPVQVVSLEWREPAPPLVVTRLEGGARHERELARCDPHGAWIEWGRL